MRVAPEWMTPVPRPVRLLRRPKVLRAIATPAGAPLRLDLEGRTRQVLHAWGPERLEPEWWRNARARSRDYYAVQLADGPRW